MDISNRTFNRYLESSGKLKHFEKVFEFKYYIANHYQEGYRKHLFGVSRLPRVISGKNEALEIYDEIVAALPTKDLAADALFAKADLLRTLKRSKESIDSLQMLVRRFPKSSLAADSYLRISKIYHDQSVLESQNPDLISLAKINLSKFSKSFPGDERITEANANLIAMQEIYAKSLYETGRFYERKKKVDASMIYYNDALSKYPTTPSAQKCQERLDKALAQK